MLSIVKYLHYAVLLTISIGVNGQLLEPRLLTNVPVKTNFVLLGYSFTTGDMLLDPALPVEDLQGHVHAGAFGYVRSLKVFKQSGKLAFVLPIASGDWEGKLDGVDTTRQQSGLGDFSIRFSYNTSGSPALRMEEYAGFQQNIITGISAQMYIPTGAYDNTKIINIGSNRFRFRFVYGISKNWKKWIAELYGALWFHGPNNDFLEGNKLTQKPLAGVKIHLIKPLPKGNWITLDGGYAFGGRTYLNGDPRDIRISTFRFGFTVAIPFAKKHNLRVVGYSGRRLEQGPDFDGIGAFYQYRWNRNK